MPNKPTPSSTGPKPPAGTEGGVITLAASKPAVVKESQSPVFNVSPEAALATATVAASGGTKADTTESKGSSNTLSGST